MSELDRLEAAVGECREMVRQAHAATKDLRAAVREAKRELQDLTKDEVAAQVHLEVSRQLTELGERTSEAITTATQKVIAEFDQFGERLLGKETYWQKASGRRAVPRPDTDVVTLDAQADEPKGLFTGRALPRVDPPSPGGIRPAAVPHSRRGSRHPRELGADGRRSSPAWLSWPVYAGPWVILA